MCCSQRKVSVHRLKSMVSIKLFILKYYLCNRNTRENAKNKIKSKHYLKGKTLRELENLDLD